MLKTIPGTAVEVFVSWIKWAVMSRILPEGSSELCLVFCFVWEASASQLPRFLFFQDVLFFKFFRPDVFEFDLLGHFSF